jgi:hypothetical protein
LSFKLEKVEKIEVMFEFVDLSAADYYERWLTNKRPLGQAQIKIYPMEHL